MNILITGACGHIGSYLVHNLYKIKKIKKAILVDNINANQFSSLFNLNKKNKVDFFRRDLNNKNILNEFKNIDIVIHLASMTNAANSFSLEKEMFNNRITVISHNNIMDQKLKTMRILN